MTQPTDHRRSTGVAARANHDPTLAPVPVRTTETRSFGPAQPVMATPAAVAFSAALAVAFGVGYNVADGVTGG